MVNLFDLPNELLLNIVDHVRGHDNISRVYKRYADLSNLSLASPRLRSMAQDALFEYVVLRKQYDSLDSCLSTLALFLRTLLEQPYFGRKVHYLRVDLATLTQHVCSCRGLQKSWSCAWAEIVELCARVVPNMRTLNDAIMDIAFWSTGIANGYALPQLGFIIVLTSQLRSLALVHYKEVGKYKETRIPTPCVRSLFGWSGNDKSAMDLSKVAGFKKLTEFSCDMPLSPELVALPALITFKITLGYSEYASIRDILLDWEDAILSKTLQRVMIGLDYSVIYYGVIQSRRYLHKLIRGLPCLTHLFLRLTDERSYMQHAPLHIYKDFSNLFHMRSELRHENLEVLSIDVLSINVSSVENNDDYCIEQAGPIDSSSQFPKLRHVVAPQDAFPSIGIQVAGRGSLVTNKDQLQGWRNDWNKF